LLSSLEKWTQGAFARDKAGQFVSIGDRSAVSWCLLGAIEASVEAREIFEKLWCHREKCGIVRKHLKLKKNTLEGCLAKWNDAPGRKFEEVRAALIACGL